MAQLRSGRPHKLTERDQQVLKHVKITCPRVATLSTEFQTASGSNVNTRTVRQGFHGRAAAHKPKITISNAKHRLEWCKACAQSEVHTEIVCRDWCGRT